MVDEHRLHHAGLTDDEGKVGSNVVSPAGFELVDIAEAPELTAGSECGEFQGVHVHHAPAVFVDDRLEFRREHFVIPVFLEGFHALDIHVVDGVGHIDGGGCGLTGSVDVEEKQLIIRIRRHCPVQHVILYAVGQYDAAIVVQHFLAVLFSCDGGSHHGNQSLFCHAGHEQFRLKKFAFPLTAGLYGLCHIIQLLGSAPVIRRDADQIGVGPVGSAGHADPHIPFGGLADDRVGVVYPLLGTPAVEFGVRARLFHGEKFHGAEAAVVEIRDLFL